MSSNDSIEDLMYEIKCLQNKISILQSDNNILNNENKLLQLNNNTSITTNNDNTISLYLKEILHLKNTNTLLSQKLISTITILKLENNN